MYHDTFNFVKMNTTPSHSNLDTPSGSGSDQDKNRECNNNKMSQYHSEHNPEDNSKSLQSSENNSENEAKRKSEDDHQLIGEHDQESKNYKSNSHDELNNESKDELKNKLNEEMNNELIGELSDESEKSESDLEENLVVQPKSRGLTIQNIDHIPRNLEEDIEQVHPNLIVDTEDKDERINEEHGPEDSTSRNNIEEKQAKKSEEANSSKESKDSNLDHRDTNVNSKDGAKKHTKFRKNSKRYFLNYSETSDTNKDDILPANYVISTKPDLVQKSRKILILYTGGTIGMQELSDGSYAPKSGLLVEKLMSMYQFQAPNRPPRTMPVTKSGIEASYDIIEYNPLLDSVNMTFVEWNKLAKDIYRFYDEYDAFVILHGTDTMAYTASALSFLLENLAKTVVLTGSQIPLSQTRSDATDNLIGSVTIATELNIPEVCVYFNGKLFRGNRCTKTNSTGLNAFSSPKHQYLARLGVDLEVKWSIVRPHPSHKLKVHQLKCSSVACLQLFPGMTDELLRKFLEPPLTGLVLLTYGTGNAPDTRKEFLNALKEATDRGVVIVNCTQCPKGSVYQGAYAAGVALTNAGVISGGDMTTEAALTKLSFLQSLDFPIETVKRLLTVDLRGERTVKSTEDFQRQQSHFLSLIARTLREQSAIGDFELFKSFLSPIILCSLASKGDLKDLRALLESNTVDVNCCDYDSRRPLQLATSYGHKDVVLLLLQNGADPNMKDRQGRTALDEAIKYKYHDIEELLRDHGAVVHLNNSK